jgi:hypothetical protein
VTIQPTDEFLVVGEAEVVGPGVVAIQFQDPETRTTSTVHVVIEQEHDNARVRSPLRVSIDEDLLRDI